MVQPAPAWRGRAYLIQRALEERRAARQATCTEARLAHRQLARRYLHEALKFRRASGPSQPEEGVSP